MTKPCTVKPLCYDFSAETAWLNDPANIKAIGARKKSWASCNRAVEVKLVFAGDWMLSFSAAIRGLLEVPRPFTSIMSVVRETEVRASLNPDTALRPRSLC